MGRAASAGLLLGAREWLGFPAQFLHGQQEEAQHSAAAHNKDKMPHPPLLTDRRQLNSLQLAGFVDALPIPETVRPSSHAHKVQLTMRECEISLHQDLPPARLWTYAAGDGRHGSLKASPVSPLIELRKGQPTEIEWINLLPPKHLFAIDHSLHGCGPDIPDVRGVAHVHGARVRTKDDGYPEDWFVPGKTRVCHYPLEQDATALWYHDHAMGLNRLNIYAGLVGMMMIRDDEEEALGLPRGSHEVPLILYDRMLDQRGQLLYPTSGNPEHSWVSEFTGDALCVNGKVRPYLQVEPTLYRFRVVNAANSRFYALSLTDKKGFRQIGSDQGLLSAAVPMTRLVLAPGERADLLVNFSDVAGKKLYLQTGVQEMLEFRVAGSASSQHPLPALPERLRTVPRTDPATAIATRRITLNEYQNNVGNSMVMLLNRKHWHEPVTETAKLNTTEIWEFVNLTEDTHPMHLHLVRFQILDRRAFEPFDYLMYGKLHFVGDLEQPAAHEMGWKDVVQCPAATVTRIAVRFEGFTGRYLYHCHILEHEANDMMRPFEVIG